jgi:U4/U6.U5 tri-snRNP component SNU23
VLYILRTSIIILDLTTVKLHFTNQRFGSHTHRIVDTPYTPSMSIRRTWDKEEYAQKAAERALREDFEETHPHDSSLAPVSAKIKDKEEYKAADASNAGPMGSSRAFIQARSNADFANADKEVGKVKVLTAAQMEMGEGAGFYCEVCKVLCKDDRAYVGHVNGKNHQRALGFSMRVEKKGLSSVKEKLASLKRKLKDGGDTIPITTSSSSSSSSSGKEEDGATADADADADVDVDVDADGAENMQAHPAQKKKRKEGGHGSDDQQSNSKGEKEGREEEEDDEGVDPEMAAMMGFGGFGGRKRR